MDDAIRIKTQEGMKNIESDKYRGSLKTTTKQKSISNTLGHINANSRRKSKYMTTVELKLGGGEERKRSSYAVICLYYLEGR